MLSWLVWGARKGGYCFCFWPHKHMTHMTHLFSSNGLGNLGIPEIGSAWAWAGLGLMMPVRLAFSRTIWRRWRPSWAKSWKLMATLLRMLAMPAFSANCSFSVAHTAHPHIPHAAHTVTVAWLGSPQHVFWVLRSMCVVHVCQYPHQWIGGQCYSDFDIIYCCCFHIFMVFVFFVWQL